MFAKFARMLIKKDKRKDRRITTRISASIGDVKGRITDISLGGCGFYAGDPDFTLGEETSMTLHLEVGDIHIPVKIAGHDHEKVVYGIAFLELTPLIFDILEKVITKKINPGQLRSRG